MTAQYVDFRWVGKLERGEHRWPSEERRAALRHVLGVATNAELDLYSPRCCDPAPTTPTIFPRQRSLAAQLQSGDDEDVDRRSLLHIAAAPALAELVAALMPFGRGGGSPTSPVAPEHVLTLHSAVKRTNAVRRAYQEGRYMQALRDLPPLLTVAARQDRYPDPAVAAVSAGVHQVASGLLLKLDDPALAAVAADRSLAAAHHTGDPVQVASSARAVVHTLTAGGHPGPAARFAESAAAALASETSLSTSVVSSVYGALLLRGAIAAARAADGDYAQALINEAETASRHVGIDGNACWTAFGPTNVIAHRVAIAVELDGAGTAIRLAETINLADLAIPERRAMLFLDLARAYLQGEKFEESFTAIRTAAWHAPEEVRTRPHAHRVLTELQQRSPHRLQRVKPRV